MDRTLPPELRHFWLINAVLVPPARVQGPARELYGVRMTLALVGLLLFAAQAASLALLGERRPALLIGLVALPLLAATTALLYFGWPRLAIALGCLQVFALQLFIHFSYGFAAGAWIHSIVVGMAAFQVYAPDDWPHRILPVSLAAAGCILPWAAPDLPPLRPLATWQVQCLLASNVVGALYASLVVSSHAASMRDHARAETARERDRADALLRNILPDPIVHRLKEQPGVIADAFEDVTVLFADLVGFTSLSAKLSSEALVLLLDDVFSAFDVLAARHGLEKIKTIGDAYMVVAGLPEARVDHARAAARMALDMQRAVGECAQKSGHALEVRIGIHSGEVVAGVIGKHKFAYDLWGDTVNIASRMESHGAPGAIQVSDATRTLVEEEFLLEPRGTIAVKGRGEMPTWFLRSAR
jgi:class 3 adenylate cyclase